MKRITIKNIGPLEHVVIDLNKVNIIMGPQSSGKSTIAKVISYCQWVEKRFILDGEYKYKFADQFIDFHRVDPNAFNENSLISYDSDFTSISYKGENYEQKISKKENNLDYQKPKNIYIPAERNFVSVIPNLGKYKETNDNIMSFLYDWYDTKRHYAKTNALAILGLGVHYHHLKENDTDILTLEKEKKQITIQNASSGLQSVTPLVMLVDYLSDSFYKRYLSPSVEEIDEFSKMINQALARRTIKNLLSEEGTKEFTNLLNTRLAYQHTNFIIEEPEQNLFPATQRDLVYFILQKINQASRNHSVLITTHSPYILYAFNNCMMGYNVKEEMPEEERSTLLSHKSWIDPNLVSVWEIENGTLKSIKDKNTGTVSKHYFNKIMNNIMDEYYEMLNYFHA